MSSRVDDAARSVLEPLRPSDAELAFRDDLTGLYNYRLLGQLLDERWGELLGLVDRFAIVILDLDLFKDVNDRYGHLSGDEVLRETGKILHRTFRAGDFVFRYGGDEFVVLLPGANAAEASALGDRARGAMLDAEFFAAGEDQRIEIPVSFSIGVAAYPADGDTGKAVLARADELLYREKQALKRKVRRHRLALSGGALALLAAIAVAVVVWFSGRVPAPVVATPPIAPVPATAGAVEASDEEPLLLARIAELQQEIDRLTRAQTAQKAPDAQKSGNDIAALRSQVRELSERLEARAPTAPPASVEAARPAERTPVERPLPEGQVETHQVAPATSTDASRTVSTAVAPPRLLEPVIPKYPPMARERRAEAKVEFNVLIDEAGRVVSATPIGPPRGFGFDEAARAAVLASHWKPGTVGGIPSPMETRLVVLFKIRQ